MNRFISFHQCCWIVFSAISAFLLLPSIASAEAPMVKTQAPGFYRMMLGQFEVTALLDGFVRLDSALLRDIPESDIQTLLARMFVDDPHKLQTSCNAYLINTGSKLVLVDAGGKATGPALGCLLQNLKASGYSPEQVDAVLMTHLHPDHVGGLVDEGKPAFPKAVVYLAKAENDYWLSDSEPEGVPAKYKSHLQKARKMVRDIAAPYLAAGQWKALENDALPIAGVKPVPTPGHTPGHLAFEVASDGQSLLIIGDLVHFAAVQFARPEASDVFDVNLAQAASARATLFRHAAESKALVAGMHLPFPGIGRLRADGNNVYCWIPIDRGPCCPSAK
jgi:glyoxylase-like metal-dependent hydrolase (beta-lactamase superfamily II)